jgi:hypothetical protein
VVCRLVAVAAGGILLAVLVCALPLSAQELPAGQELPATVLSVTGTAEVQLVAGQPWQPAQAGMKLAAGTVITVGVKSMVELDFDGHAAVVIRRPSILRVDRFLLSAGAVETRLRLKVGSLRAGVVKEQVTSDFKVTTPDVTLSARGTDIADVTHSDRGTEVHMGREGRLDMTKLVERTVLTRSIPADGASRSSDLIRVVEEKMLEQSMQGYRYGRTEAEERSARMAPGGQDEPKAELVREAGHPEVGRRREQEAYEAEPGP